MLRNLVLVGMLGLAWGLNWPAVRLVLDEIPPWTFRAVGFSAATLLTFGIILALGASPAVPRRHWLRLVAVGALSTVAYNLFSAFAQLSASTSRSAVLSYTMPIWTVIFARIVLGEPFDSPRKVGLALGVAGLVALGWPLVQSGELSWGLLFAVLSGVVWAAGSVMLKRWPIAASPLVITGWQLGLGAIATTCGMLAFEGLPRHVPALPQTWLGLGYNIVIGQAFASTLWFTMLGRMPAGIASIGSLLVPGIGVIGATVILGERPTGSDWIGLILIVAAAATVLLRSTDPSSPVSSLAPSPDPSATDRSSLSATLAGVIRTRRS